MANGSMCKGRADALHEIACTLNSDLRKPLRLVCDYALKTVQIVSSFLKPPMKKEVSPSSVGDRSGQTEGLSHAQNARIGSRDDDSECRRAERRHKDTLASRGYCLLQADDSTTLFDCDEG
jgi:hypothetical protein